MLPFKIEIQEVRIQVEEVLADLPESEHGAQVLFLGVVRNHNQGRTVIAVEYDIHPVLAKTVLHRICEESDEKWGPGLKIILKHRVGKLDVGEASIAIAVGSPHRNEAYHASRFIIDQIKHRAPIWKKEFYHEGETEWLEGHSLCAHSEQIGIN